MSESSGRVHRLAEQLVGWPRRRVPLPELWRLFDEVDPATRGSTRRRQLLADCLAELGAAGVIELPAAASFDRTQRPPLPRFVTIPTPRIDPPPQINSTVPPGIRSGTPTCHGPRRCE
ncbi:MAG: hypothetical protein ACRDSZ_14315 [Pseudonocardiaceae bacterium]